MFTAPPSVQYQIAQFFRINNQRRVGSRDKSCSNALLYGTGAEVSGVLGKPSRFNPRKKGPKTSTRSTFFLRPSNVDVFCDPDFLDICSNITSFRGPFFAIF